MVQADHPALPGHFPGRPVVPGVVLLDEALALVLGRVPGRDLAALPGVKFLAPVLPGQEIAVSFSVQGNCIAFSCKVGDVAVLRGAARLRP